MNKFALKSKTINSALLIILIAAMSFLGMDKDQVAQTYDTVEQETGHTVDYAKEIITILSAVGVIYGRYKADGKINWSTKNE